MAKVLGEGVVSFSTREAVDLVAPENPFQTHAGDWVPEPALIDVDVLTLMSGRHYSFGRYLDGLKALDYPRDRLHLLWYTNSRDQSFLSLAACSVAQLCGDGFDARMVVDPALVPSKQALREILPTDGTPHEHANVIAALYNRSLAMTARDVFFLEDDIVCERSTLKRLLSHAAIHEAGYVGAPVGDRHSEAMFAWDIVQNEDGSFGGKEVPKKEQAGLRKVGLAGLACVFMRRWAIDKIGRPLMKVWPPAKMPDNLFGGCDIVMCFEMEHLGIVRLCDFGCRPDHIDSKGVSH